MTSDVRGREYDLAFDTLDANANGVLEEQDFVTLGKSIARAAGIADSSAKATTLAGEWRRCWVLLLEHADANGDGLISREEFRQAMSGAQGDPAVLERNLRAGFEAEFAVIDTDDDGVATVEQMAEFLLAWGLESDMARTVAERLDRNGDGHITREEYVTGWSGCFLEEGGEEARGAGSPLVGFGG
ncbi:EF-hand domain-containing protein [Streptomyces sp. NPDC004111]|uniref:EF-hand domain-containing protein n=1 Tax=Streptomyces sp. NPDC004111 TaxID=3364690 RepID=UPI003699DA00